MPLMATTDRLTPRPGALRFRTARHRRTARRGCARAGPEPRRRHALRAERCSLVDVTGDNMEPELFDGDSALVDHSRCDPVEGEIFALRTLEGPLVKRLRFHDDRWWASSDNDSSENGSRPLDGDDGIIGRVVWWAHTIVEGEPQPASD